MSSLRQVTQTTGLDRYYRFNGQHIHVRLDGRYPTDGDWLAAFVVSPAGGLEAGQRISDWAEKFSELPAK